MTKRRKAGDWHPAIIKAKLEMAGHSLAGLSRANGLPEHACRHALRYPGHAAEVAIAKALGVDPEDIWPSRYDASGQSLHPPRRLYVPHISTVYGGDPLQKVKAA